MRLGLLGAFAFPAPLGSQRFAAEQARALREAGAEVEVIAYGAGARWRGFDARKLPADAALARALVAAHRARPFDAVLAHNAEAALVALAVRRRLGIPVVYVIHTLWAEELETWLPALPAFVPLARRCGRTLDLALARAADGVLVLSEAARRALAPSARGPVAHIAPGHTAAPTPAASDIAAACTRVALAPGGFALYAGNLDRYQDLGLLDAAASVHRLPVVVVTHAARGVQFRQLRVIEVGSVEQARLLTYGAAVALLPRRSRGGFPIKLLHYMEAGRAIVARRGVAETLVHDESAWLVPDDAGPEAFGAALHRLGADPLLRERLGAGARRALETHHAWPPRAQTTLSFLGSLVDSSS